MDREKVIAWLADEELYYREHGDTHNSLMACDALALLKEQGYVKPVKTRGYNPPVYTHYEYECEECKSPILYRQPYCCGCGRPVLWTTE